MLGAMCDNHLN